MLAAREQICWLLGAWALLLMLTCQSVQLASPNSTNKAKGLKLIAEYKNNHLEGLSSDGRLILLYQTSTPMRTYTFRSDTGRGKADQPDTHDDLLRVIELKNGRELGHLGTEAFPGVEGFIPNTQEVFYSERKQYAQKMGQAYKIWNPASGQLHVCLDNPAGGFSWPVFLDQQQAIGIVSQKGSSEILAKLTLPECTLTNLGPVAPERSKNGAWQKLALSPDKRFLAYTIYPGGELIIWDIANKKVTERITPSSLLFDSTLDYRAFGSNIDYSADGKLLIVNANIVNGNANVRKEYLLTFDTSTYQLKKRIEVPALATAMAISPDGRMAAIGYTEEMQKFFSTNEQGVIALYDLTTGQEIATAAHSEVKQRRSDPFIARVRRLAFTPDGEYLLSSTYDTRVWQITSSKN